MKAHRLLYHSTLGLRVIKKKKKAYRVRKIAAALLPGASSHDLSQLLPLILHLPPFEISRLISKVGLCLPRRARPRLVRTHHPPKAAPHRRASVADKIQLIPIKSQTTGWCGSEYGRVRVPLSSEHCTFMTVEARFWPRLSGQSPLNLSRCSLFARKPTRRQTDDACVFAISLALSLSLSVD